MNEEVRRVHCQGATCKGMIGWIKMTSGKMMPVDFPEKVFRHPDDEGSMVVTRDGRLVKIGPINTTAGRSQAKGFGPHWATCPDANGWETRKEKGGRDGATMGLDPRGGDDVDPGRG